MSIYVVNYPNNETEMSFKIIFYTSWVKTNYLHSHRKIN